MVLPWPDLLFYIEKCGQRQLDELTARRNDTRLGRQIKRELKEVAKHYREQYKLIEENPNHVLAGYV